MRIELCPETGICSIVNEDGKKVDLMPDEVDQIKEASGDPGKIRVVLAGIDNGFAGSLSLEELVQISSEVK